MRTKALLGLAALVASAFTSVAADNVYSLNIVGYYNVPTVGGLTAMAVSMKAGANKANEVIPYSDGDNIQVWSGSSWTLYLMDSGSSTGWADAGGGEVALADLPVLSPGKGFFYGKNTSITNVTIVGEVPLGTNTVSVPSGLQALGSMIPWGGAIDNATTVNLQVPDGSNVQFWTGSSWSLKIRDSGSSTGWTDDGGNEIASPSINVGQGFFLGNNGGAFNWTQVLNNQ